ncbi:MAG: MoaD/ThiS family protein [Thermodesulfobacteriota bacterium]|nr:MoaD/ThiS family protein [Thermodesulfobacteriota bacterium]
MNIKVKLIGFPDLKRIIGSNEVAVQVDGGTFGDLLKHLERTYGPPIRKALLDKKGAIDKSVQVMRNEREWISREDLTFPLNDGECLTFLLMVAGG